MMTIIRRIITEFREFPASSTLGAAWVLVFGLMLVNYLQVTAAPSLSQVVLGNFTSAHHYGDLTPNELFHGETWRAITCTFVHYNLLHISLNLYGLYQLGGLVESWYGSGLFLAIYALIAGGGNIISAMIRRGLGSNLAMHSGGGSTVVLGLVALAAVVGWRMKTRIGDYLRRQMVGILAFTAVLGILLPIIDNWGHAGGAIVGACIGLGHKYLILASKRAITYWAGAVATILLVASAAAQVRDNRFEARLQTQLSQALVRLATTELACRRLAEIELFYRLALQTAARDHLTDPTAGGPVARPGPWRRVPVEPWPHLNINERDLTTDLPKYLAALDSLRGEVGTPPTTADFSKVRELLANVLRKPATIENWREFRARWGVLLRRAREDQLRARTSIERISRNQSVGG